MSRSFQREFSHYDIFGATYALPLMKTGNKTKEQILLDSTILFAQNGYAALSMRELASAIGIKPASLYNYFESKNDLWNAVLDHAMSLYRLYFDRVSEALSQTDDFKKMLEIIFDEPKKMRNIFTCYAFYLVRSEQFRDVMSANLFNGSMLDFSINILQKHFNRSIQKGTTPFFDTEAVAAVIMNSVLDALNLKIQEHLGRKVPYHYSDMLNRIQKMLLTVAYYGCYNGDSQPITADDGRQPSLL